jgi:ATP-dependent Clp protease ATP-binding subunit ClpB
MEIDSSPVEIDELRRLVDRLTMEELALEREEDAASKDRLDRLRQDLADRREQLAALTARWEQEKAGLNRVGELKSQLDEARIQAERLQREGNLGEASAILYGQIPQIEAELATAAAAESTAAQADPMVKDEVGPDDVAEVVSAWTGIPAGRLLEGETEKLLRMEEIIGARLIGQVTAVRAVSDAVRRARAGVADPDRPTGSFLFLGPTGVGKTELAKSLADFLFDDERAMVRIDMSEYSERHSVARLVGAPPGYVGYEEGGQLTEAVRRRPYTVVLLDEVEKAHPEVFDILLQVLDDGRLTDGQGRTVDFRNAILVLTSNLGSAFLVDPVLDQATKREFVLSAVRAAFKPEFLNRLDDIVIFDPLDTADLARIVDLQVDALAKRLTDRRLELEVSDSAREWLAMTGYDPAYGARPLRRLVQTQIGDRLARAILSGDVHDGDVVRIDLDQAGDELFISNPIVQIRTQIVELTERLRRLQNSVASKADAAAVETLVAAISESEEGLAALTGLLQSVDDRLEMTSAEAKDMGSEVARIGEVVSKLERQASTTKAKDVQNWSNMIDALAELRARLQSLENVARQAEKSIRLRPSRVRAVPITPRWKRGE